jgi:hypothetical protein
LRIITEGHGMKRRRTRKPVATPAIVSDDTAPTPEWLSKHVQVRHGSARRILTRLEKWLESGDISAAAGAAGLRFHRDYSLALGKSMAKWNLGMPRTIGGDRDPTTTTLDAASRYRMACTAIAATGLPARAIEWLVIDDLSVREISQRLSTPNEKKVKRMLIAALDALAEFYSDLDGERGRDETPQTVGDALSLFSPPLADAEAA